MMPVLLEVNKVGNTHEYRVHADEKLSQFLGFIVVKMGASSIEWVATGEAVPSGTMKRAKGERPGSAATRAWCVASGIDPTLLIKMQVDGRDVTVQVADKSGGRQVLDEAENPIGVVRWEPRGQVWGWGAEASDQVFGHYIKLCDAIAPLLAWSRAGVAGGVDWSRTVR